MCELCDRLKADNTMPNEIKTLILMSLHGSSREQASERVFGVVVRPINKKKINEMLVSCYQKRPPELTQELFVSMLASMRAYCYRAVVAEDIVAQLCGIAGQHHPKEALYMITMAAKDLADREALLELNRQQEEENPKTKAAKEFLEGLLNR